MNHEILKFGKFYQIYRCYNDNDKIACSLYTDKECLLGSSTLHLDDILFLLSFNHIFCKPGFTDQFSLKVLTSVGKIGYIWSGLDSKLIIKEINES